MKKVLLIGGCGYIGSALYLYLKQKPEYIVDTVDIEWFGNYSNPHNIKQDFVELSENFLDRFDVIVLTAANSSVQLCGNMYDTFNNNVVKFIDLVNKLHRQKFIYASSSCVYGTSDAEFKIETDRLNPLDGLTFSKTTIDHYMPLSDVEFYGLRFGSVNGWAPNFRLDLMINAMSFSAINQKKVNVFNGHAYRPILPINDLCRAVETIILSTEDRRGLYNVAAENENILQIGIRVAKYFNVPLIDNGKNFTYDFSISSQKFMNTFNFTFNGTIETIIDSIVTNPHDPRWERRDEIRRK